MPERVQARDHDRSSPWTGELRPGPCHAGFRRGCKSAYGHARETISGHGSGYTADARSAGPWPCLRLLTMPARSRRVRRGTAVTGRHSWFSRMRTPESVRSQRSDEPRGQSPGPLACPARMPRWQGAERQAEQVGGNAGRVVTGPAAGSIGRWWPSGSASCAVPRSCRAGSTPGSAPASAGCRGAAAGLAWRPTRPSPPRRRPLRARCAGPSRR